jgi:long-chain-fatty-acid--CoA ligase ACSBG
VNIYGAAPIKKTTLDYFASLDIPILGAYGMSETSAAGCISPIILFNQNSTGKVPLGMEIKISNPDEKGQGEICFRGRHVMMGYLKNEAATRETIDNQGYLHSGDLGKFDDQGFLYITGRIKELIITAGGENIAPVLLEDTFKEACPQCSNIMVIGDQQKYLVALITLKVDVDMAKGGLPTNNLTSEVKQFFKNQLNAGEVNTTEDAIANEKVQRYI